MDKRKKLDGAIPVLLYTNEKISDLSQRLYGKDEKTKLRKEFTNEFGIPPGNFRSSYGDQRIQPCRNHSKVVNITLEPARVRDVTLYELSELEEPSALITAIRCRGVTFAGEPINYEGEVVRHPLEGRKYFVSIITPEQRARFTFMLESGVIRCYGTAPIWMDDVILVDLEIRFDYFDPGVNPTITHPPGLETLLAVGHKHHATPCPPEFASRIHALIPALHYTSDMITHIRQRFFPGMEPMQFSGLFRDVIGVPPSMYRTMFKRSIVKRIKADEPTVVTLNLLSETDRRILQTETLADPSTAVSKIEISKITFNGDEIPVGKSDNGYIGYRRFTFEVHDRQCTLTIDPWGITWELSTHLWHQPKPPRFKTTDQLLAIVELTTCHLPPLHTPPLPAGITNKDIEEMETTLKVNGASVAYSAMHVITDVVNDRIKGKFSYDVILDKKYDSTYTLSFATQALAEAHQAKTLRNWKRVLDQQIERGA